MERIAWRHWLMPTVLLTAACSTVPDPATPPPGAAEWRQGYIDGCVAGYVEAGREGYHGRYITRHPDAADADYRIGWEGGHRACYEEERRVPRLMPSA